MALRIWACRGLGKPADGQCFRWAWMTVFRDPTMAPVLAYAPGLRKKGQPNAVATAAKMAKAAKPIIFGFGLFTKAASRLDYLRLALRYGSSEKPEEETGGDGSLSSSAWSPESASGPASPPYGRGWPAAGLAFPRGRGLVPHARGRGVRIDTADRQKVQSVTDARFEDSCASSRTTPASRRLPNSGEVRELDSRCPSRPRPQ